MSSITCHLFFSKDYEQFLSTSHFKHFSDHPAFTLKLSAYENELFADSFLPHQIMGFARRSTTAATRLHIADFLAGILSNRRMASGRVSHLRGNAGKWPAVG